MPAPIVYRPDLEHREADEFQTTEKLVETLLEIQERTSADGGHALRGVHAKSHALLRGTFQVLPGLAPPYAQGLFATPARYPVVLRLSTDPGDLLPDSVSAPRAVALKVIGVPGERLEGSERDTTQDFLMGDGPAFGVRHAKDFAPMLALVAKTTDRAEGLKKVLSTILRGLEATLEGVGSKSNLLQQIGGRLATHPLGDTYFSQAPFRYGEHIAKFSLAPLTKVPEEHLNLVGHPDALRQAIGAVTSSAATAWQLRAQLCVDLERMPIEDASKVWDEALSPFVPVAWIDFPAQPAWSSEASAAIDDGMAFDVWHALAAHRPLGSINRVRRLAYKSSAEFRSTFNKCPLREPQA